MTWDIYVNGNYDDKYLLDEVNIGDTVILHDLRDLINYEMSVEHAEDYKCESCPFGYDNELDEYKCPYRECHNMGVTFKLISSVRTGINMGMYVRISDVAKKICNSDTCIYYRSDESCKMSDSCLLKIIVM